MANKQQDSQAPPHDVRAEAALLGAILLDNEVLYRAVSLVQTDHFYRQSHREIFNAMKELGEADQPIDAVTLSEHLKTNDRLKQVGGVPYLVELSNETPLTSNVERYAEIVAEKHLVRSIITASKATMNQGLGDPTDIDDFIEAAQRRILEVTSERTTSQTLTIREVISDTFKHIEKLYDRKEQITGIPTGFIDLDSKLTGLQPSDLLILAARPSMGKTALAVNMVVNAALKSGVPAVLFSLEMSARQLAMRMLCTHARVSMGELKTGQLTDNDWTKLIKAVGTLSEARIYVDETPALTIMDLRARCRRLKRERGLGLVAVDYLQLMRSSELAARRGREQEISEISRGLKALAKELDVPVIGVSQLNRGVESRTDKRPLMSDLRESGAIEQDADVVMFLYRDEYYNKETDKPGLAEVIIAKQRNGPTGTVELKFTGRYTRFDNFAKSPPPGDLSPF